MEWTPTERDEGPGRPLGPAATDLLAAIVESSHDAIIGADLAGTILSWNRGAEDLFGYTAAEMLGHNVVAVLGGDGQDPPRDVLGRVASGEPSVEYEAVRRRKDGNTVQIAVTISPILDATGAIIGASAIARNIERQKQVERLLTRQALHDSLTDLPNRTLLLDRIENALAQAERDGRAIAVLFLDLDGFKSVNDRRGHVTGDRVLQIIARRLREAVRTGDTVSRFGGDEFVLLCHDVMDEENARRVAARIEQSIETPIEVDNESIKVRAAIGTALGRPGAIPENLIKDADLEMYRMKGDRVAAQEGSR
jgi:diguanylate cyclase (GGDEF)-like protein/PAS domain S-box-containing protein